MELKTVLYIIIIVIIIIVLWNTFGGFHAIRNIDVSGFVNEIKP